MNNLLKVKKNIYKIDFSFKKRDIFHIKQYIQTLLI